MSLIADVILHEELLLFTRTFERVSEAVCVFEDFHYVTTEDASVYYVFFWWTTGCDFDEFESAMTRDPTVSGFESIIHDEDRGLYRIESQEVPSEHPLVFPLFRSHNVTTLETRRDATGLHVRARFPDRHSLQGFRIAATRISDRVEVKRLFSATDTPEVGSSLTQKQREALALAYEAGYFEIPSEASLEDVAEELDITPQALSRHIRAGVRAIIPEALSTHEIPQRRSLQ